MAEINRELIKYIEAEILPQYEKNDRGHDINHIKYVIERSLKFAKEIDDINLDMVYTIACYHDIGVSIDRANHEKVSGEMFYQDNKMKEFFSDEERIIIKEAIEDHRASSEKEPRSIYGKIVSSADRNVTLDEPFIRTFEYRFKNSPWLTLDEIIAESHEHLADKFGHQGYAKEKMYFDDSDYQKMLEELNKILSDKELFRKEYLRINKIDEKEFALRRARSLCKQVQDLASLYNLDYFFVTEQASCCHITHNEAVRASRANHAKWEKEHGFNPEETWDSEE